MQTWQTFRYYLYTWQSYRYSDLTSVELDASNTLHIYEHIGRFNNSKVSPRAKKGTKTVKTSSTKWQWLQINGQFYLNVPIPFYLVWRRNFCFCDRPVLIIKISPFIIFSVSVTYSEFELNSECLIVSWLWKDFDFSKTRPKYKSAGDRSTKFYQLVYFVRLTT